MASIISIFDPFYEEYSLGMFTMFEEIRLAQEQGLDYYYPGYIFDNNPAFDYKIRKENMQYLNPSSGRWGNFKRLKRQQTISYLIERKIQDLHAIILDHGIDMCPRYYPLNSLGYLKFERNIFIKGIYLLIAQISTEQFITIEYLPETNNYLVSKALINHSYICLLYTSDAADD